MPSNFIEKYLGKSRRTKVVLLARFFLFGRAPYPSFSHYSFVPGPERNIAFLSSCKQNPFLLLEHSLEIDSAYIGLPTALQPLGLRFPFSSARRDASFSSLRLPSCRVRGFLFRFHRAAPTVCRGALCNVVPVPSSLEKAKLRNHEGDVGTRVRWRQGRRGINFSALGRRSSRIEEFYSSSNRSRSNE